MSGTAAAQPEALTTGGTAACPDCKGLGTVNCVTGCLTCGRCGGSGRIDPAAPSDFVSLVRRQFARRDAAESERAAAAARAASPDVFTAEEAARFLRLANVRAWNRRRRAAGVAGERSGRTRIFAREQVEAVRKHMFGLVHGSNGKGNR